MAEFRLETERLVLRSWRDADLGPLHELCNDAEVMRYLGPHQSLAELEAGIAPHRVWQVELGYCFWPIERKSDGLFLGFCGLKPGLKDSPIAHMLEIGWRLRRDCWGKGIAREAAEASLDWAWRNLDTNEVVAITVAANTRSWGLMLRLGMHRVEDGDFDHPALAENDPLRRHELYRIERPR